MPRNLITLAACEVGEGKLELGEGVMSLNRAFRMGGAATVLSSRWKADARAANALFSSFYRLLKDRKNSPESLGEAKREFLSQAPPALTHPYYWANFAHWGEAFRLPQRFVFLYQFLGFVLLGGILYGFWRRRRK